jgi:hypothetical protein
VTVGSTVADPTSSPSDPSRRRDVLNTRDGVAALLVGAALSCLPVLFPAAAVFAVIGTLLVFHGRHAFGSAHSRRAEAALALLVAVSIAGAFLMGLIIGSAGGQSSPFSLFDVALQTFVFLYAGFGLVAMLLLPGLGGPQSARLLWLAFGANLAAGVVLLAWYDLWIKVFILSQGPGVWFGDGVTALDAALIMMRRVPIFYVPAGALYGLSSYLTWTRIPHPPRSGIGEAAPRAKEI